MACAQCLETRGAGGTIVLRASLSSHMPAKSATLDFSWAARGEALFPCARPSGVPRGPANYTGSLTSQRHPGKFPKVPGIGVAFQAPPGSQASSRGQAKDSALLSSRDAGSELGVTLSGAGGVLPVTQR